MSPMDRLELIEHLLGGSPIERVPFEMPTHIEPRRVHRNLGEFQSHPNLPPERYRRDLGPNFQEVNGRVMANLGKTEDRIAQLIANEKLRRIRR